MPRSDWINGALGTPATSGAAWSFLRGKVVYFGGQIRHVRPVQGELCCRRGGGCLGQANNK